MNRVRVLIAVAAAAPMSVSGWASSAPAATIATTVYGADPCPKARSDEIVVCAREPESERYRIPKRFRAGPRVESGASASWASRVEDLEAAQRPTRPNSCSAVGSNGQTGCTQAMLHQWYLERHMAHDLQP